MAEFSSSGEESSEEEEGDKSASPSLRGATSPITAANRQTSGEKRALYSERGYLNSLSRQERRRIKREIRKGRKLALTVSNITSTLAGITWRRIGIDILGLPESKCDEISSQCSTDEERTAALVREWLLRDPLASWRRIINNLYNQGYDTHYLGDSIIHNAEELTDTSLTHSNLTQLLSSMATRDLRGCLDIPVNVSVRITRDCGDDEEQQREQLIHYYITCSPDALMGWSHIAGKLHYKGEETAERAAKDYVQRAPEPSLMLENLNTVMESISEGRLWDVGAWLHIPVSKLVELHQQYPVVAQHRRAYSAYFLTHHPAPCWRIIATALYKIKELGALEVVQKLYLRVSEGTPAALTLQDVAAHAGIMRLNILDQECSQQVLLCLAKHCVEWQLIGLHLKLTDGDITAVDGDNRTVDEKRVGVLRRWKERFAFKATYLVFVQALLACGRTSDAVNACKAIVLGIGASSEEKLQYNSSMSVEDFCQWLRSRGISEKDCKILCENGITHSGFIQLDAEDFDDIGLTKFGKKLILKFLAEVVCAPP